MSPALIENTSNIGENSPPEFDLKKIRSFINKNHEAVIFACLGILVFVFIFMLYFFFLSKNTKNNFSYNLTSVAIPSPVPTPYPLAQGPQTYLVGMKGNPRIMQISFNTIDPKKTLQEVSVKAEDTLGGEITSVTADVKTDRISKSYELALNAGTAINGFWSGHWVLNDTYNRNFVITFSLDDNKNMHSSVDLTIR